MMNHIDKQFIKHENEALLDAYEIPIFIYVKR